MGTIFLGLGAGLALAYLVQIATGRPPAGAWGRSLVKTGATLGLVVWGLWSAAPGGIVLGLALGAAGDFFLSRRCKPMFLAGMAAFAAGHLAYVAALWARAGDLGFATPTPAQMAMLAALGLGVLALGLWLSSRAGALRLPVLGYTMVIGLMTATAVILPPHAGRGLIWLGAALFLGSDTLLALRMFVAGDRAQKPLDLAVWPSYWLGQALILVGATAYWGRLAG